MRRLLLSLTLLLIIDRNRVFSFPHINFTRNCIRFGTGEYFFPTECSGVRLQMSSKKDVKSAKNKKDEEDMKKALRYLKTIEEKKERKKDKKKAMARFEAKKSPKSKTDSTFQLIAHENKSQKNSLKPANPHSKVTNIASKFNVVDLTGIEFVGSFAEDESKWPVAEIPEIAFLGRSNVGKSSMLNCLFGEKVATVSKTPGRTRLINIFTAFGKSKEELCRLTDLPGYGYAKMAKDNQKTIEGFLPQYLQQRKQLKLLVLLVDCRRNPLASDIEILEFIHNANVAYKVLVAATKVDKLSESEVKENLSRIQEEFGLPDGLPVAFSAATGKGRKEILQYIKDACEMEVE